MLKMVCGAHIADVAWRHPGLAIYILVPQVLPEATHATALGPQRMIRGAGLAAAVPEIHVQMNGHVHDVRERLAAVALRVRSQVQACRTIPPWLPEMGQTSMDKAMYAPLAGVQALLLLRNLIVQDSSLQCNLYLASSCNMI